MCNGNDISNHEDGNKKTSAWETTRATAIGDTNNDNVKNKINSINNGSTTTTTVWTTIVSMTMTNPDGDDDNIIKWLKDVFNSSLSLKTVSNLCGALFSTDNTRNENRVGGKPFFLCGNTWVKVTFRSDDVREHTHDDLCCRSISVLHFASSWKRFPFGFGRDR